MPSPKTDSKKARQEFDQIVDSIAAEREGQAQRLQPVLNAYLRHWDDEQQRLTRDQKGRPADEIAQAKKEMVELVTTALERLDLSIYRGELPCKLMLVVGESNRRGQFWLMPQGLKKPLAQKANLSDLFNLREGDPEIRVATQRREALVEWRAKVQANPPSRRSK